MHGAVPPPRPNLFDLWFRQNLFGTEYIRELHDVRVELDRHGFVGRPAWVDLELGTRPPPVDVTEPREWSMPLQGDYGVRQSCPSHQAHLRSHSAGGSSNVLHGSCGSPDVLGRLDWRSQARSSTRGRHRLQHNGSRWVRGVCRPRTRDTCYTGSVCSLAWRKRWSRMVSISCARAFATSRCGRGGWGSLQMPLTCSTRRDGQFDGC